MKQAFALTILIVILLIPGQTLAASNHIEYNVNISKDRSATWKIIIAADLNSTIDDLEELQTKLLSKIDTAKKATARDMALDMMSLEMKTDMLWETSSQTIEYIFRWENFSTVKEGQIIFGDVFTENFFSTFYGNGELRVTFPEEYLVNSVSPRPDQQNNPPQTLHWYRTLNFLTQKPEIILAREEADTNPPLATYAIMGSGVIGALAIGILLFNHKKQRRQKTLEINEPALHFEGQDNKEQVLQLLRNSGGSAKQSEICTKLKFSRAKTSILLAEMEKNSQVRRDKKGKNKIVYIIKQDR
jgi:hypothetical protein